MQDDNRTDVRYLLVLWNERVSNPSKTEILSFLERLTNEKPSELRLYATGPDRDECIMISGRNQNRTFVQYYRFDDDTTSSVEDPSQTEDVELTIGGATLEYGDPTMAVPMEMAKEALLYFFEHRGMSPKLIWHWDSD